jgi:hypothetical protein
VTVRQALLLVAGVWVVTTAPYFYGFTITSPDRFFTGLLIDVPDHAQYWSWVTASRAGLFISDTMTPEPNPPVFMNVMMWLLARTQSSLSLSFGALFQVWRLSAIVVLVLALRAFLNTLVRNESVRWTALWLALVGSGFGWLLIVAKTGLHLPEAPYPSDIYTVEPNTFLGLLAYPYLPLAQAFVLLSCIGVWRAQVLNDRRGIVLAGVSAFAGTALHAYDALVIYTAIGAYALVTWVRARQFPVRLFAAGIFVVACSAPVVLYYTRLTSGTELWQSILTQYANAGVWTPRHIHLVILMGLPLVLAAAAVATRTIPDEGAVFAASWSIAGLGLIYVPTVYQIKMLAAWQFPLAILAAHFWHARALPWLPKMISWKTATIGLVVAASMTNIYLYLWRFTELRHQETPYYLHRDEAEALDWMSTHATADDVALAPERLGQFTPNYGRTRAYLAHWAMTNRFYERRENVSRFFGTATDSWHEALLSREGVTMVVCSTFGSGAIAFDPKAAAYLQEAYVSPVVQIYRVRRSEK